MTPGLHHCQSKYRILLFLFLLSLLEIDEVPLQDLPEMSARNYYCCNFSHASVSLGFCLKYQLHRKEEQEDAAMEAERG